MEEPFKVMAVSLSKRKASEFAEQSDSMVHYLSWDFTVALILQMKNWGCEDEVAKGLKQLIGSQLVQQGGLILLQ